MTDPAWSVSVIHMSVGSHRHDKDITNDREAFQRFYLDVPERTRTIDLIRLAEELFQVQKPVFFGGQ